MKLSTRSRYGVRLMVALAEKANEGPTFLKDIAATEEISEKYLSLIVIPLRAAGLIRSIRGARGGYVLAKPADHITVHDILDAVEESTCLVACVKSPQNCSRLAICPTRDIWGRVSDAISETLSKTTLDMLALESSTKKAGIDGRRRSPKKGKKDICKT